MGSEGLRPGFNLDVTFRAHLSTVRFVKYNPKCGFFISCDDKSFKAWTAHKDGTTTIVKDVLFPGFQSTFITAMTVTVEPINLVFAACLDGNLRLYTDKLRLASCMPWSNGAVRDMAFNVKRAELITAGSYGLKAWTCDMDYEAYRNDKNVDPFAIPRSKDGQILPWGFGKYQHARQRCVYIVPGARTITTGHKSETHSVGSTDWCERVMMHEATQTLFALFRGSIFGFDAETGVAKMCFQDLHEMPVTSMLYAPDSNTLMTATLEDGVTVWRIAGGKPHRFRTFGKSVNYVVPDDVCKPTCLLTCSSDGQIALWALDASQPMYHMKLAAPVCGPPSFFAKNRILLHLGNEVRVFSIQHLAEVWAECNAAPIQLRSLPSSGGLVLAEYADSSVRLLDAASTETDKSCVTIPPQLSSSALQSAAVSLARARLYALLSSGELHVWQLARGRPPMFAAAWSHLVREKCCALTLVEAASLPSLNKPGAKVRPGVLDPHAASRAAVTQGLVTALHLELDDRTGEPCEHLVLGTASGDIVVVDADHGGAITSRFPAFKQQALHRIHLCLDGDKPLLLAVARCCLKVWTLEEQLRCVHVLDTSQQIRCLELLGNQAILGTTSGSVHLVDIRTGMATAAASSVDHLDAVMGCGPSDRLGHFVTCGRDSQIKVFDGRKVLKRSIYLATPPSAICYLNDLGDLLIAVQKKLLVVRASTYEAMMAEDYNPHNNALYANASPITCITRPIHPHLVPPSALVATTATVSSLPNVRPISGQGMHTHASIATSSAKQSQQTSSASTPMPGTLPVLSKATSSKSMSSKSLQRNQSSTKDVVKVEGNAGEAGPQQVAGRQGRTSRRFSRTSGTSTAGAVQQDDNGQQGDGNEPQAALQPSASSVRRTTDGQVPPAHKTYHVAVDAPLPAGIKEATGLTPRPASTPISNYNQSSLGSAEEGSGTGSDYSGSSSEGSGSSGSSGSSSDYSGSDSDTGSSGSSGSSSSSSEESREDRRARRATAKQKALLARRAAEEQADLHRRQLAFLVENYKMMNLPFQTMYKVDLSSEAIKQQRKRFGLMVEEEEDVPAAGNPASAAASRPVSAAPHAAADSAAGLVLGMTDASGGAFSMAALDGLAQGPAGWSMFPGMQDGTWQSTTSGLAQRFHKLLPLLSSPCALLEDGTLPPDLMGMIPPVTYGKPQRRKKNKKKKSKTSKPSRQQETVAALLAGTAGKAAGPGKVSGAVLQTGHLMDSLLSQKQLPLPPAFTEKKKKKRRKKKGRNLAAMDPVDYLERVAKTNHAVMVELRAYDTHRMLTRTCARGDAEAGKLRKIKAAKPPPLASTRDAPSFRTVLKALQNGWNGGRDDAGKHEQQALELLSKIM